MAAYSPSWLETLLVATAERPHAPGMPSSRGDPRRLHHLVRWIAHDGGLLYGLPRAAPGIPPGASTVVRTAAAVVDGRHPGLGPPQRSRAVVNALGAVAGMLPPASSPALAQWWEHSLAAALSLPQATQRACHTVVLVRAAAAAARRPQPGLMAPLATRARTEAGLWLSTAAAMAAAAGWGPPAQPPLGTLVATAWVMPALLVDALSQGWLDPKDGAAQRQLAVAWGLPVPRVRRQVRRAADVMRNHAGVPLDLLSPPERVASRMGGWLQRVVVRNLDAVVREVRETGELAALLAKAASGNTLSAAEWIAVRAQLLDVARAVPSLALFALPGGAVLLPLLLRVLPFDLRPSAFRDVAEPGSHPAPRGPP